MNIETNEVWKIVKNYLY